jgi:hypothetical protein
MCRISLVLLVAFFLVIQPQAARAQRADANSKIENALSAAPAAIANGATVMDWDNTVLRQGTNGWTCFPDAPHSPGRDPMCLDAQWVKWAGAWAGHTTPQVNGLGVAYMLRGGSDASNIDPYATQPTPGNEWVESGPHVMVIVPDLRMLDQLPTDPKNGGPYVMWKGTPYAHIMVPVVGQ